MEMIIWLIPIVIAAIIMIRQFVRTWKDGLFLSLLQLVWTVAAAVGGFFLTHALVNPAKMDLFGLGKKLAEMIPQNIYKGLPYLEGLVLALPTALIAIIAFPVVFDVLRAAGCWVLRKCNKKFGWSEKILHFRGEKIAAEATGLVTSAVCLMTDMVIFAGMLTFCGNMFYCAETITHDETFASMNSAVHTLEENPVIRLSNSMGAEQILDYLTTAQRNGEAFSVSSELTRMSKAAVDLMPVVEMVIPSGNHRPTGNDFRELSTKLKDAPEGMELMVDIVKSYEEELEKSDAVQAFTEMTGTTPAQVQAYVASIDAETAPEDVETICEVAAILTDYGVMTGPNQEVDLEAAMSNEALLEEVKAAVLSNENMRKYLGIE